MKLKWTLVAVLAFACCTLQAQNDGLYKVVYEADRNGKRVSGSLEELVQYVRSGNPIRVGWKLGRLEHWADAGFITILKDHVFAQISSIYGQGTSAPSIEVPFVALTTGNPHGWTAVFGTTGEVRQKFERDPQMVKYFKNQGLTDEQVNEQFKKQEKARYATMWAVMVKDE